MKKAFCDMCEKEIILIWNMIVQDPTNSINDMFELCEDCTDKIKKQIRMEVRKNG